MQCVWKVPCALRLVDGLPELEGAALHKQLLSVPEGCCNSEKQICCVFVDEHDRQLTNL